MPGFAHWLALATALVSCLAGECAVETLHLPPLVIHGHPANAHTQGIEWVGENLYVTARREDVSPRRALLLRTALARHGWDVWDVTPEVEGGSGVPFDHPGGFQFSDGALWIPIAQSRRAGKTSIRVFKTAELNPGRMPRPELEFAVEDHIGALAVSSKHKLMLGASWDTDSVQVWNLEGRWLRTLNGVELDRRTLGVNNAKETRIGLAVQDWKFVGDRLLALGQRKGPPGKAGTGSELRFYDAFLEPRFEMKTEVLEPAHGVELGREGFAVKAGFAYFLPEDLGGTNRLFRASLKELESGSRIEIVK